MLNVVKLGDLKAFLPMDRNDFYENEIKLFKSGQKSDLVVSVINVLLFNTKGEVLIQKRSYTKKHNPGLLDKSIGGHIDWDNQSDYTAMVETIQELQIPSVVLKDEADFKKTLNILKDYLGTVCLVRFIDKHLYKLPKLINGDWIEINNLVSFYLGVYDGRIRPIDGEVKGVLWYSLEDLRREMTQTPEVFTPDLRHYLEIYEEEIAKFILATKKD